MLALTVKKTCSIDVGFLRGPLDGGCLCPRVTNAKAGPGSEGKQAVIKNTPLRFYLKPLAGQKMHLAGWKEAVRLSALFFLGAFFMQPVCSCQLISHYRATTKCEHWGSKLQSSYLHGKPFTNSM